MKRCPFCAEEIQNAAIVCNHCGRDLLTATPSSAVAEPPRESGQRKWVALGVVTALALQGVPSLRSPLLEPEEPCTIEAHASFRPIAEVWCDGGFFTKIKISTDAYDFVVLQQFSRKGQRAWQDQRRDDQLNLLRALTDAFSTNLNQDHRRDQLNLLRALTGSTNPKVAFSLHGTDGQVIGGCVRERGAPGLRERVAPGLMCKVGQL